MSSNWDRAQAERVKAIAAALVCPRCGAANRIGVTVVEFDPRAWSSRCGICHFEFIQQLTDEPPA